MIPKHCIKLFNAKYNGVYPSHTMISMSEELFNKLISRSELLWCHHSINKIDGDYNDVMLSSLHSFHEEGIYIYLDDIKTIQIGASTKKVTEYEVYFMYRMDRKHIVDFTINQIIKQMKDGN